MDNAMNHQKGGPVSRAAAMLCQDPSFRAWLSVMQEKSDTSSMTEGECATWLRRACGVTSRARLDHEVQPRIMFNKIRNRYRADIREVKLEKSIGYQPWRSDAYLYWVKSLPSVISGRPADDAHHVIGQGFGGMGTKASDLFTFALTRDEHDELHRDSRAWEEKYGSQWFHAMRTVERAMFEGVLVVAG